MMADTRQQQRRSEVDQKTEADDNEPREHAHENSLAEKLSRAKGKPLARKKELRSGLYSFAVHALKTAEP